MSSQAQSTDSNIELVQKRDDTANNPDDWGRLYDWSETEPEVNSGDALTKRLDGGLQAWACVSGSCCLLFVSAGWINCIGIFQAQYEHQLPSYTSSELAWIPSLQVFIMFASGSLVGKLYDNFGSFYIILSGTLLHIFGVMMISLGREYYQIILAQGVCSPLGASCLFYAALNSTSTWFDERRALALGVVVSGASIGSAILPIMLQQLLPHLGFAASIRAIAFLMLGLCIVGQVLVRSRSPPTPKPLSLIEFVAPLREPGFLMFTLGAGFFFWGMFVPFDFLVVQGLAAGMEEGLANYLVVILNGTSFFGRVLPGYLADKVGLFTTITSLSALSAILVFALWLPASLAASIPALVSFAALYGFSSGAFVSLAPACVARISPMESLGVRQGVFFACISLGALTGNPIAGAIRGLQGGGFVGLMVWTGVCLGIGSWFLGVAWWTVSGKNFRGMVRR